MFRRTLPIFLLTFAVWGVTAALTGSAIAQGPMIAGADNAAHTGDAQTPLLLAMDPGITPVEGNPEGPALGAQGGEPVQASPNPSAEAPPDRPVDIPQDQEALYREVLQLKKVVDRLRDEADARDRLRVTADEERDKDAEILEAAGREYSLRPLWVFDMDLNVQYSYNAYDIIRMIDINSGNQVEYHSDHTITNSLSLGSGIRDNLSLGATVPFVYKYDHVGTAQSMDVTGLGDISLNMQYQPLKTGQGYPAPIFFLDYTLPTGKGTFDINPQTELATGSGLYSISGGLSVSQPFDPVNTFASVSYTQALGKSNIGQTRPGAPGLLDEVDPGASISGSLGFGYALSYRTSLTLSLSYAYGFSSDYYWLSERNDGSDTMDTVKTSSGDAVSASLNVGTAWRLTPGRTIILTIGKGLTTANPGFSFAIRLPVSFDKR